MTDSKNLQTKAAKDYFDFKEHPTVEQNFAADYLRQYYAPNRPVTDDEAAVYSFISKISTKLKNIKTCLDVGCGPTVHHAIMLAPYVASLDVADYLDSSLTYVIDWVQKNPDCWDWSRYTQFCISHDGEAVTQESVLAREAETRAKINNIFSINLLQSPPIAIPILPKYDLVTAFYCTEEIALTLEKWRLVIANITKLIKPGGYLLMSCLENTDYYHVLGSDGVSREMPSAKITEDALLNTLKLTGFDQSTLELTKFQTPGQANEGVPGILLTLAQLT